ncbi:MAG: ATP-binding protein [Candidatus Saccharibacteria bacterium]
MNLRTSKSKPADAAEVAPGISYWHLFHDLPEPHMLFRANDPQYTIVDMNKARERQTGTRRRQAIGRPLFEVFPPPDEESRKIGLGLQRRWLRKVIRTGREVRLDVMRYDLLQPDGTAAARFWQPLYQPIFDENGKVAYILSSTRDITGEITAERRITDAESRLEAALSIGKVGSWVWDVDLDLVIADSNMAKLFGLTKRDTVMGLPLKQLLRAVHPEDRARVSKAMAATVRKQLPFEEEYRTYAANGELHWLLARGKLQEQDGRLLFPGVIVDVTERRDLLAQVELGRRQDQLNRQAAKILQDRNEELETLAQTKDEFVALASHQLRTPATAVKQYIGMVLQGYAGTVSDVQREMLEKAFESNERQLQIITQILNAARADTGRLAVAPIPADLCNLVRGIADDMRPTLEQHRHSFRFSMPKRPVPVRADLGYLRMAIENILHNADVYTPAGGDVRMRLTTSGRECRLSVTDTGVGIRKADLGKLFVKFSRIHNPLSVEAGGSGIGLYLTAEIVRLHGGRVDVESKIGKGSSFTIVLPLAPGREKNGLGAK